MDSSERPQRGERICDHCGAANDPGARECWLCEGVIPPRAMPHGQWRRDEPIWPREAVRRFLRWSGSIPEPPPTNLLVEATVLAMAVAALVTAPAIGIVLLVSIIPALFVTRAWDRRRWRRGRPMTAIGYMLRVIVLSIVVPVALILALLMAVFVIMALRDFS
jgi:hypothetical protein